MTLIQQARDMTFISGCSMVPLLVLNQRGCIMITPLMLYPSICSIVLYMFFFSCGVLSKMKSITYLCLDRQWLRKMKSITYLCLDRQWLRRRTYPLCCHSTSRRRLKGDASIFVWDVQRYRYVTCCGSRGISDVLES
jgi:hypothetical protein